MLSSFFLAFVPIFVAVDALGTLPLFVGLTQGMPVPDRRKLIRNSVLTALVVAILFLLIGNFTFLWLGITINDFLIAGGAILFILSIRDLMRVSKDKALPEYMGVVPLAVPLIVGPAVLTSSLILLNEYGFIITTASLVVNIALCGVILTNAHSIGALLGQTGSQTLSKISSLLLAAIGVMLIRRGVFEMLQDLRTLLDK